MIPTECKCNLSDDTVEQCTCGYGYFWNMMERLWRTCSRAESLEIMRNAGIQAGETAPNPFDIQERANEGPWPPRFGDRHPVYTSYEWVRKNGRDHWAWVGGKGN